MMLAAAPAFASNVRTLAVDNQAMAPVFLRMGKSTVLRFPEKPKKVVVGNQNYYGLEFIDNDVAIQPLGAVGTNLFVYTEGHTYGFLLTPGERYDDLVFVRWKYGMEARGERRPVTATHSMNPNVSFTAGRDLKITILKVEGPSTFGLHLIDCVIENAGKGEADLSTLSVKAARQGRALDRQRMVVEAEKLKPREKTRARLILKLDEKKDISIEAKWSGGSGKGVVLRKFL
jgi:hypothetical protein